MVDYREKAMVECLNCGRRFFTDSYVKHKKNCVLINGENKNITAEERSKKDSQLYSSAHV
jgi:hypothetical protein